MALITCPDCSTAVSDAAPACPKCGRPFQVASAAPNAYRQSSTKTVGPEKKRSGVVSVTISSFAVFLIGLAVAVCFVPALQIGQHIETSCRVNGAGSGTCQFTNTGWTPGSDCIDVRLVNKQGGIASSGPLCSGRVWPNDTTQKDVTIVMGDICSADGLVSWNEACSMDIRDLAESGDMPTGTSLQTPAPKVADSPLPPSDAAAPKAPSPENAPAPEPATPSAIAENASASNDPQPDSSVPDQANIATAPPPADSSAGAPTSSPGSDTSVLQKVIANPKGPSFDCSTATDLTARAICGNAQLSLLDRQMAILYYSHTDYTKDSAVRDRQREWIRNRNQSCGADVVCLTEQFNQRISELQ